MTDARFSGGNMPGSDDGFGYFPASSPTSTSTPFGGNPGGFGQPAGPHTGFGGGTGSTPSRRRPSKVATNLGGFLVVAIVIAIVGGAGWWWMHRQAGLSLPTTVAGIPVTTDPVLIAAADKAAAAAPATKDEIKVGGYGNLQSGPGVILILVRGPDPMVAPGPEPADTKHVGPVACNVVQAAMVCYRDEGLRGVEIVAGSGPGNPVLQADSVAEWVQEVWNTNGQ
jgi:hypothetical protein